jgi:hypothetical protein
MISFEESNIRKTERKAIVRADMEAGKRTIFPRRFSKSQTRPIKTRIEYCMA